MPSEGRQVQRRRLGHEVLGVERVLTESSVRKGDGIAEERSIEVYDPDAGRWAVVIEELPMSVKHMRALPYHHRLLLYSAHNDRGTIDLAFVELP